MKIKKIIKMMSVGCIASMLLLNNHAMDINAMTTRNEVSQRNEVVRDVSSGWNVLDYTSNLNIPVEDVFIQEHVSPYNAKMAMLSFANIGKATFKATKTIPLKAGVTYKINLGYALAFQNPQENKPEPVGTIDFNGTTFAATESANASSAFGKELGNDNMYREEITPTTDMDYVITIEFECPRYWGLTMAVGYYLDDPTGGFNPATSSLSYNANGAFQGTPPIDSKKYVENEPATVLSEGDLSLEGYTFAGWNTASDGNGQRYQTGDNINVNGAMTLYAQWEANDVGATSNNNIEDTSSNINSKTMNNQDIGNTPLPVTGTNTLINAFVGIIILGVGSALYKKFSK